MRSSTWRRRRSACRRSRAPRSAYGYAICDGDNGRLATTQDDWRRALDHLLREPGERERLGAAALADVATRYAEHARARELQTIVDTVRGGLRRRVQSSQPVVAASFADEPAMRTALEPDACPAFVVAAADGVSPPLPPGSRLVQHWAWPGTGCYASTSTPSPTGRDSRHRLRLALRREDGTLAGSVTVPADDAPDRGWLALDLDAPEQFSGGRTYLLEITAEGPGGGSALSFGTTSGDGRGDASRTGARGPALLDGVSIAAALVVRGFADWRHALGADDAADSCEAEDGASLPQCASRDGGSEATAGGARP